MHMFTDVLKVKDTDVLTCPVSEAQSGESSAYLGTPESTRILSILSQSMQVSGYRVCVKHVSAHTLLFTNCRLGSK